MRMKLLVCTIDLSNGLIKLHSLFQVKLIAILSVKRILEVSERKRKRKRRKRTGCAFFSGHYFYMLTPFSRQGKNQRQRLWQKLWRKARNTKLV